MQVPEEPFITGKFWVEIDSIVGAQFTECTGLQIQTDTFEYSEGGLNSYTHKLPVRTKVGNITLKRGIITMDTLFDWYNEVVQGKIVPRTVTIHVLENKVLAESSTKVSWVLHDALPVKYTGPSFKVAETAIAVDSVEFVCGALTRM